MSLVVSEILAVASLALALGAVSDQNPYRGGCLALAAILAAISIFLHRSER